MIRYKITFTTPLFSKGALDVPEIRPPSIRGQLHWWFRALGGSYENEKAVFGGVHNGACASKVVIRVSNIEGSTRDFNTLPHKQGGPAAPKPAYEPGSSFELHVLTRLGDFNLPQQKELFSRTLETWLLLGTLGLRATRAAGSFVWTPLSEDGVVMPDTPEAYAAQCRSILGNAPLKFALLNTRYDAAEDARCVVSDTLGGRNDTEGENDLARLNNPLGKIFRGRKTSPLRFRIVSPDGNGFYIAAVWDGRQLVTGNRANDLEGIVKLLQKKKPALGNQLLKILY